MSSDVLEPETSADIPQGQPAPFQLPESSRSNDDLSLNSLLGQAPDPMLDPLTSSSDELTRLISSAKPDPLLASESVADAVPEASEGDPVAIDHSEGFSPDPGPIDVSDDSTINALDLIQTDTSPTIPPASDDEETEDEDDEESAPRTSLLVILLASYASAVTIGLVWVLLSGRKVQESPSLADDSAVSSPRDPGVRADRSRTLSGPVAIPETHRVTLGKTIRVGDLEITPLALTEGPVELERTLTERVLKKEGDHALTLAIRFRNVSQSSLFAPLDEAFIRQRLRTEPESFVESMSGVPIIANYPLAVESEWSIVGQVFRELRPQETFESLIVSEADVLTKVEPEMIWRIRLRTGIERLGDVGVVMNATEIKAGK